MGQKIAKNCSCPRKLPLINPRSQVTSHVIFRAKIHVLCGAGIRTRDLLSSHIAPLTTLLHSY
jgi:hypothetical protein